MIAISLTNNCGGKIDIDVDFARGRVSGPDALAFLRAVEQWDGDGNLYGTQPAPAPDPLHDPHDLAVMLATIGYNLTDDLAAYLPPPENIPEDAIA
jgi:hypothetical protein